MNTKPTLLLLLFITLFSPLQGEEIDDQALIGKWLHSYKIGETFKITGTTVYKEDGTFSGRSIYFEKDKEVEQVLYRGKWSIEGNILTTVTRFTSDPSLPNPITQKCEIIKLTEEIYTYKSPEGEILTEHKVK